MYFEQTVPFYSIDEFQSHFHMKRTTFETLVREVAGTGVIPVGNPFGRQVIGAGKEVSIFLWCIANRGTTRLKFPIDSVLHIAVSQQWFGASRKVYWPYETNTLSGQMVRLLLLIYLSSKNVSLVQNKICLLDT